MIDELQKRSFVRLLLLWICGILLQVFFPYKWVGVGLLLILCGFVVLLFCLNYKGKLLPQYNSRWVWGLVFSGLLVLLSFTITGYKGNAASPDSSGRLKREAAHVQYQMLESIEQLSLSDTEKSVFAALTIGYKKAIPRETRYRFSISGVSHILAVSGFHVAVVCGFLTFLFRYLPRIPSLTVFRYLLTMSLLWSFVFVSGLAASAVRAGLMLSFYLTGQVFRRNADSYNTLSAAAFCMLAYNPFYLFDIGFQLSYTAVFFILCLQPKFQSLITVHNPLLLYPWSSLTVTGAAQIGTTFLCLYHFGYFSLVFLFTNLPVMFFATILIPLGLIWMILPSWLPGYAWLQMSVEKLTHSLVYVTDSFGTLPGAGYIYRFDSFSLIVGYIVLLLLILFFYYKRRELLFAALSVALFFLFFRLFGKSIL